MDKKHSKILMKRRVRLLQDLNPTDMVMDYMLGESILTEGEYEQIKIQSTSKKQATEMLGIVPKKGRRSFAMFVEGLLESESEAHHDLADMLKQDAREAGAPIDETDGAPAPTQPTPIGGASRVPAPSAQHDASDGWFSLQSAPQVERIAAKPAGEDQQDFDLIYPMRHEVHGLALIVNNRNFTCNMKDRKGSDVDAAQLERTYTKLGFRTHILTNLTGQQLRDNLFSLATHDHSNNDAVLVTILSHGLEGKIYGTDGDLVDVAEFTSYFRGNVATSLAGKPKIFILQACRGGTFDTGIDATDGEESGVLETEEELFQRFLQSCPANRDNPDAEIDGHLGSLPVEADMLMAYATVPGYVSWRNSERGSWFVQALVKVLNERADKEHLMDMLTMVNQLVATEFQSKGRQKQMPAPVSHLRKKLYFKKMA